ncbi:MAG: 1-deoxy-D-xylulose-5-phosphate reductoisomerase [Clostridia bacterium]|nr:1-deoxy-D-xylulose-5-phosphate reductoisomerase [Clostridia bacterium]
MAKKIALLGSTGSIGTQTLEVKDMDEELEIAALTAHKNTALLEKQIRKYKPRLAAMSDEKAAAELKIKVKDTDTKVLSGEEGVIECAGAGDVAVTAIVGIAGLRPTMAAIDAGCDIALSNKETLVTAGHIVMDFAKKKNVKIIPVDSEHSAIFQSISNQSAFVDKIIITASGGPFFGRKRDEIYNMTAQDALKHPNWSMGAKITIDSATLVNKGLEIIEAMHLFGVDIDNIIPVVHRQSIVHSLVEFCDGSVIGQLGVPDMKLPISYALHYPKRAMRVTERLDLAKIGTLTFDEIDNEAFPAVNMAKRAAKTGGTMPAVFNGANEEAVGMFLRGECRFGDITEYIAKAVDKHIVKASPTIEEIEEADRFARQAVREAANKN